MLADSISIPAKEMETQKIVDFPYRSTDKRPRKRPRLTWDMPPPLPPPSAAAKVDILYNVLFVIC